MYQVAECDRIVELTDVPQSSVGAPIPFVMSDEHSLVLAYYLQESDPAWDGTTVRVVSPDLDGVHLYRARDMSDDEII